MLHATLDQMVDMQHAAQPVCKLITPKSKQVLQTCQSPLLEIPAGPVFNPMPVCLACSSDLVKVIIITTTSSSMTCYVHV